MYAREIDAQFDCRDCEASSHEWTMRGQCLGQVQDAHGPGVATLRVELEGVNSTACYPEEFQTCPKGLLRGDLRRDEVTLAGMVSHAAAAEADKRWPEIPARLHVLIREWRVAESQRMTAEHEARMESARGPRVAR